MLTVFTQKLLLNVQLHNSTVHLLYKYCRNCKFCNWTVFTLITQKLLLHIQVQSNTAHLLYKYCNNCTVYNWTVLTVITQKLPLHIQLHNNTETVQLMSSEVQCSRLFDITSTYTDIHIQKLDPSKHSNYCTCPATNLQRYPTQASEASGECKVANFATYLAWCDDLIQEY